MLNHTFNSCFKNAIQDFILYKRALGFEYEHSALHLLRQIDHFFIKEDVNELEITKEVFEKFVIKKDSEKRITQGKRFNMFKQFCLFLIKNNYENIYFTDDYNMQYRTTHIPYIFTEQEIQNIFHFIDNFNWYNYPKSSGLVYPVLARLLYSTGLRISEALNIKINDLNLDLGSININKSKNNSSRKVFLSDSMKMCIFNYMSNINFEENDYLFKRNNGKKYQTQGAGLFFRNIFKQMGIYDNQKSENNPRTHDFRHTFAIHSLEKMIKEGVNLYVTLPYLSKYMGHADIRGTEYYLRLTDQSFGNIIDKSENVIPAVVRWKRILITI